MKTLFPVHTRQNLVVSLVLAISMVGISYGAGGVLPGDGLSGSTAYLIEDLADFDVFADPCNSATYWSSGVYTKLTCDPNLTGRTYTTAVIAPDGSSCFEGIFDGASHIISNLTINTAGAGNDYLGLFGRIEGSGAKIKNLGIENINITGVYSVYIGGLCGVIDGVIISNCYSTGTIVGGDWSSYIGGLYGATYCDGTNTISDCYSTSTVSGGDDSHRLGGLCGETSGTTITNSYSTGSVFGGDASYNLGGLCGDISEPGAITNCFSTGSVTGGANSHSIGGLSGKNVDITISNCFSTGSVTGGDNSGYLGGLCGYITDVNITNSYSTSLVSGGDGASYLGGLCGFNCMDNTITNCYSTGMVTAGNNASVLGGLCGDTGYGNTITNCYSTGAVVAGAGTTYLGGLCGRNSGNVTTSFWDTETSGIADPEAGTPDTDGMIGQTTVEMQTESTFTDAGWDFSEIWVMSDMGGSFNGCPILLWQNDIQVALISITISGPGEVDENTETVYTCIAQYNNGSTADVTALTNWSENSVYASIDDGLLSTVDISGNQICTITAEYSENNVTKTKDYSVIIIDTDSGDMGGGDGSETTPYLIEDYSDFQEFTNPDNAGTYWASGVYTRLECELDLDPVVTGIPVYTTAVIAPDTPDTNSSFNGIPFEGIFDGNGYIISNLTIDTAGAGNDYLGLFGKIQGSGVEINNLGMVDVNITSGADSDNLGGLVGYNYGTINNCYASGSVIGGDDSDFLGGLCGYNGYGCTITNCYATGSVIGGTDSDYLGGLCGFNYYGCTITNCYATGSVTGGTDSDYLGGLCGKNYSTITNCYAAGSVTGGDNSYDLGGLCGINPGTITNCLWDVETGGPDNGIGTPKTTAQMQMQSTFTDTGWDFTNETANGTHQIWQMPTGGGYPVLGIFDGYTPVVLSGNGTEASPYLISNAAELGAIYHYDSNACFRLQSDIDLTGIQWSIAIVPVYGGCFDGNGYVIYNLNIEGGNYLGLFGKISGFSAEVKNLGIENINITGEGALGGLCGDNYEGTITNCYATGSVTGGGSLGGLCGGNYEGTITNCYATGSIIGGDGPWYLGGLCGISRSGTITNCYATGSVTGGGAGSRSLGGLCGDNDDYGTISNCYATGSVTGGDNSDFLGGLCGRNYVGTISNCYATGTVSGGDSSDYLGGLCGRSGSGIIINCHSTGNVSGTNYVGGLCGTIYDADYTGASITSSYSTGTVSGTNYVGGLCGNSSRSSIMSSYSTGVVIGTDENIGGLCGRVSCGSIINCYSTGQTTGGNYVGGLCGYQVTSGNISNCYATGLVTGDSYVAGLCGYQSGYEYGSEIINCFWDTETSGMTVGYNQSDDNPGTIWNVVGKTTAQMQTESTFTDAGWDFTMVPLWRMPFEVVGYPMLGWQKDIPGDFAGSYGVDMVDLATIMDAWLSDDTPTANWNEDCDLDDSGVIDTGDLKIFVENWLAGT